MAFIGQDKIFYGASAFLGLLAIIYFGFEYLVALSPFTISAILFSVFLLFLGLGLRAGRGRNSAVLAFIFSAGSYVVALFYTMSQFSFGSNPVLVSLILSSGLMAAIGYLVTQKEFEFEKKQFKYGLVFLTILVGGLVAYDIGSGEVNHSYILEDEFTVAEEVSIGEVTAEKNSFLPYKSSGVNFNACLYNETGGRQPVRTGFSSDIETMKFGSVEETQDITMELGLEELGMEGTYPIEESDESTVRCPQEAEGAKMLVTVSGDNLERTG